MANMSLLHAEREDLIVLLRRQFEKVVVRELSEVRVCLYEDREVLSESERED